jgi:sulfur relay (sulfurtransferase) DsrC/TusE family protein
MTSLMDEIRAGGAPAAPDPAFPHAPEGWTKARALEIAREENLKLEAAHWTALRALQEYFVRHDPTEINLRELHDALDEKFHREGGIRQLYLPPRRTQGTRGRHRQGFRQRRLVRVRRGRAIE